MERDAFELMAAGERDHWWFRGRREFIGAAFRRLSLPPQATLLDAGCGSGGNLELLSTFGTLYGFEYDEQARATATALGIGTIAPGALPDAVPFPDTRFDAIGLFDVLEHLAAPVESLRALAARLRNNGAIVITVPAHQWLWGPHDEHHQHFRRYSRRTLRAHLESAGLHVAYMSHFNTLLLPLAVAQRARERLFGYNVNALIPSPSVNTLLFDIFQLEKGWIPKRSIPFGVSLLAIAYPARNT